MLQYVGLFICVLTRSVHGVHPSKPYLKDVNVSYHRLFAEKPKTTLLIPLENEEEYGSGGGGAQLSDSGTCKYDYLQRNIEELRQISSSCVDKIKFQNCCEPKFLGHSWLNSTVYPMETPFRRANFAYCDMETDGGGWMVILRRGYKNKFRSDFMDRSLSKYEIGFGKLNRDFWMGFKAVQYFADQNNGVELLVELKRDGMRYFAHYNNFTLGNLSTGYALHVGGFREESTLPDSLSHSNGFRFLTKYQNIDCHRNLSGPWWYGERGNVKCSRVNLFKSATKLDCPPGQEFTVDPLTCEPGPMWEIDGVRVAFNYVEMKIRPKTWECGMHLYKEYELKKAYLYPQYP